MAQPLTPFWPIFTVKSDGQEVVSQKGTPLRNGPTEEQLDRTPNEQGQADYYRLLDKDEPKHIDWRKKLGGMLLRELGGKQYEDKWQQSILWDFPDGYRLYEHIKSKANGEAKATKNHSGGGHDRQDAYLYGYPKGPRKRFRSPVDFFPHLLWLCTDEDSDYANCSCRICSPNQIDNQMALSTTVATPPAPASRNPPPPSRRSSGGTSATPSATPNAPPASASTIKPPPRLEATVLPQPRSIDQQVDSQYGKFVARTGEVVWFARKGPSEAYGLGLVVRRWAPRNNSGERSYLVQPLSYPADNPAQEVVETDRKIKPWLAWSCPQFTYQYLQQNPGMRYEQVDWSTLVTGRLGQGIAEVDASILAAKAIDNTYTLYERLKTTTNNGVEERLYNGIYLGAEKIWRGEPIRLRLGPGTDVLVLSEIIEKVYPTSAAGTKPKVELRGDIYTYATISVKDSASTPEVPTTNQIPLRMREDMRWRNQFLVPETQTFAYWKLAAVNARVGLEDIKGRWYETSLLFEDFFQTAVRNRQGGNGIWMNSRGDALGLPGSVGAAWPDRVAAFGRAVPAGLHLVEGLDPPQQQPQSLGPVNEMQSAELAVVPTGAGDGTFALDDFMNFDNQDDSAMGFGENYHF